MLVQLARALDQERAVGDRECDARALCAQFRANVVTSKESVRFTRFEQDHSEFTQSQWIWCLPSWKGFRSLLGSSLLTIMKRIGQEEDSVRHGRW